MFKLDDIEKTEIQNTFYSVYECAAVVNQWFADNGMDRELAPQMFYNYTKKGYIETFVFEDKKYVNAETLQVWWVAYVKKNVLNKTTQKLSRDQIVAAPSLD
jgi:hypothetical protein